MIDNLFQTTLNDAFAAKRLPLPNAETRQNCMQVMWKHVRNGPVSAFTDITVKIVNELSNIESMFQDSVMCFLCARYSHLPKHKKYDVRFHRVHFDTFMREYLCLISSEPLIHKGVMAASPTELRCLCMTIMRVVINRIVPTVQIVERQAAPKPAAAAAAATADDGKPRFVPVVGTAGVHIEPLSDSALAPSHISNNSFPLLDPKDVVQPLLNGNMMDANAAGIVAQQAVAAAAAATSPGDTPNAGNATAGAIPTPPPLPPALANNATTATTTASQQQTNQTAPQQQQPQQQQQQQAPSGAAKDLFSFPADLPSIHVQETVKNAEEFAVPILSDAPAQFQYNRDEKTAKSQDGLDLPLSNVSFGAEIQKIIEAPPPENLITMQTPTAPVNPDDSITNKLAAPAMIVSAITPATHHNVMQGGGGNIARLPSSHLAQSHPPQPQQQQQQQQSSVAASEGESSVATTATSSTVASSVASSSATVVSAAGGHSVMSGLTM